MRLVISQRHPKVKQLTMNVFGRGHQPKSNLLILMSNRGLAEIVNMYGKGDLGKKPGVRENSGPQI